MQTTNQASLKCRILDGLILWQDTQIGEVGKATIAPGETLDLPFSTCTYLLAPMPGGDVVFAGAPGVIAIERKAGTNFTSSYTSRELAGQLTTMLACHDEVVLVIESNNLVALCDNAGLDYATVAQDLVTYQTQGVRVLTSLSRPHTAAVVAALYDYYQRPAHGAFARRGRQSVLLNLYERTLQIPGWGLVKMRAALQALRTPQAIVNATDDVLLAIPGVTKRAIANLRAATGYREEQAGS